MDQVHIVGIAGGSGSGKTTIVNRITELVRDYALVPQDNYYKSAEYVNNQFITGFNFDHPDAFDSDLLLEQLQQLKVGMPIRMPQYDFVHHRRRNETVLVEPRRLVILEGIMIYFDKRVRDLIDLKLYVDTPDDIRFIRRLKRDITERGRTVDSVIEQYTERVRPGHYEFVEPTKAYADLVILEGIMIFFDPRVRALIDLKLYVDTPDDIRFIRRLRRDITERGRTVDSVIEQYTERVRPGHYEFVEPTKAYADLVIPEGGFNARAMEALTPFLRQIAG